VPRRDIGAVGSADVLLVVIIAMFSKKHGVASKYFTDGLRSGKN